MCLELLSTLAAFASSDDPRESGIASTLFELMEKQEATSVNGSARSPNSSAWRTDRRFLARDERGDLPPTRISTELRLSADEIPALRASLQPFAYQDHSVAFSYSPSYVEMHTIEPLIPNAGLLLASDEHEGPNPQHQTPVSSRRRSSTGGGGEGHRGESAGRQRRSSRKEGARSMPSETLPEFKPPAMFGKLRTPLVPQSTAASTGSASSGVGESSFDVLGSLAELNSSRTSSRGSKSR